MRLKAVPWGRTWKSAIFLNASDSFGLENFHNRISTTAFKVGALRLKKEEEREPFLSQEIHDTTEYPLTKSSIL